MYYNTAYLRGGGFLGLCRSLCYCHDIAPDLPPIQDERANTGGVDCDLEEEEDNTSPPSSNGQDSQATAISECSDVGGRDPSVIYSSHFTCQANFYGHPSAADCKAAIKRLPDWRVESNVIREYVPAGYSPNTSESPYAVQDFSVGNETLFSFRPIIMAPLVITVQTCTVAVLLPENPPQPPEPALVSSRAVNDAAKKLEAECVSALGSGGKFDHFWYLNGDFVVPNILIFEKGSLMDDWLNLKMTEPVPKPKSNSQACSGSCMDPNDCDINSDCVCASNKPIPLSSTWGQHACMYVAGAALAHVQAKAIKPYPRCRGRCLSQDNDMINGTELANITDIATSGSNVSLANVTSLLPYHSPLRVPSSTRSGAYSHVNDSISLVFDNASTSVPPISSGSSAVPKDRPPVTDLTCPCNCTYVSAACCLSRIVWEDPQQQIKMDPLPANATVCCQASSGKWLPKTSSGSLCTR